jgi:ribosomal protein L30/L7E
MSKLVAVKIRGSIDSRASIQKTLDSLKLGDKNNAVVLEDTESNRGMLRKAKDYIAYGEVEDDVAEEVEESNLAPPSGGFKSTKKQRHQGGSLGKRDDMEALLEKML